MKKKILFLLMNLMYVFTVCLFAQPMASMRVPYRQVIISEYRGSSNESRDNKYIEITNVGDSSVNLEHFYFVNFNNNFEQATVIRGELNTILNIYPKVGLAVPETPLTQYTRLPDHLLKPGESFVISEVYDRGNADGSLVHRKELFFKTDWHVHARENPLDSTIYQFVYPEYKCYDFDSISKHHDLLNFFSWSRQLILQRIYNAEGQVIDSVAIDGQNLYYQEDGGGLSRTQILSYAGVENAILDNILVRKSNITSGNLNGDAHCGVSSEDSEWLLIPKFGGSAPDYPGRKIWSTIGVHGNYKVTAESEVLGIDLASGTLTVPWGIYKVNNGDSIIQHYMTIGPGMAWQYIHNAENFIGGGQTICQTGDTLVLYATGDVLEIKELRILVNEPEVSESRVFPGRIMSPTPDAFGRPQWGGIPYYVTNYANLMDTVGNIPFATRIDTLFKYLEKPLKANWQILWADGKPRADLKNGDILLVTAENGTDARKYYLDVLEFVPGTNSNLASITWPDKPGFMMDWVMDTIPGFNPVTRLYNVLIPYTYKDVPALQVTTQDPNARVQMFPAVNLDGSSSERTTHIQVTAQDDSTVSNYYVTFNKEKPTGVYQPWEAEPIISEIIYCAPTGGADAWLEIYNPGTEPIDLSNYMFSVSAKEPPTTITDVIASINGNYANRYSVNSNSVYIPGFKWPATKDLWDLNPGHVVFDPIVNPILEPGDVWIFGQNQHVNTLPDDPITQLADVVFMGRNRWGETDATGGFFQQFFRGTRGAYLWKILNDSIQNGMKAIKDPADFELVERWGIRTGASTIIAGRDLSALTPGRTIIRKPQIVTPDPENPTRGWGTNAEDSDWIVLFTGDTHEGLSLSTNRDICFDLGRHTADEVTLYRSTIQSEVYKVDDGYKGDLNIKGVSNGEIVEAFLGKLVKADPDQNLVVSGSSGGDTKEMTDLVAEGDLLTVVSANGESQTKYRISTLPLDNNNTLILAEGSNLVITREGNNGIISGFPFGTTIKAVLEKVVKPVSATLRIENAEGGLLPLTVMNNDTLKVSAKVSSDVNFKVIAENGDVAIYNLQPIVLASDAYVLSDLYLIDQEASTISQVLSGTTVASLYSNLIPVPGASMVVRDKNGMKRAFGTIRYDDFLYVTSEDQSTIKNYFIQIAGEPEGLQTEFRRLCPDPSNLSVAEISIDGSEITLVWDYNSGLEYGFVIVRDGVAIDTVYATAFTDQGLVKGSAYEYSVYAYNEFGNSGSKTLLVYAFPSSLDTHESESISIFPTITIDMVYFKNLPEGSRIVLTDIQGRTILTRNPSIMGSELSLRPYSNGYYLVRVMQGQNELRTLKILKK